MTTKLFILGHDVDELTREEAITLVKILARRLEHEREDRPKLLEIERLLAEHRAEYRHGR